MKVILVGNKTSDKTKEVETVIRKLFPNAEVEIRTKVSHSESGEYNQINVSDVHDKSKSVMARNILEVLDIGMSDKVLSKLG